MTDQLDVLDRLAAEKIMGWVLYEGGGCAMKGTYKLNGEYHLNKDKWQPTRNITQAWEVLEKFEMERPFLEFSTDTISWYCDFKNIPGEEIFGEAPTAPEAIVRACLKAKGVEID